MSEDVTIKVKSESDTAGIDKAKDAIDNLHTAKSDDIQVCLTASPFSIK